MLSNMKAEVPLVEFVYRRCLESEEADIVAVLTSDKVSDDPLYDHCTGRDIPVFRGSLDNVLDRYIKAALHYKADIICRVCGDSPFADMALADDMFRMCVREERDYVAPIKNDCIAGLDSEVFTLKALQRSAEMGADPEEAEHVTLYIARHKDEFNTSYLPVSMKPDNLKSVKLTVDSFEDMEFCRNVAAMLGDTYSFKYAEVIKSVQKACK